MIKKLKKFTIQLIAGANIASVILLLLVGYSDRLNPTDHPLLSTAGMTFPAFLIINLLFLFFWLLFKWRMIWIPILGFVLAYVPISIYLPLNRSREVPDDAIKLLSYNVCAYGGNYKYDNGFEVVRDYLFDQQPDIVCLQEDIDTWRRCIFKDYEKIGKKYRDIYNDPDSTDDDYDYASEVLGDLLNIAFEYIIDGGDDTVYYTEEQLRQMSVNNFVENLYLTILNRQFDAAGRDSWLNCIMQQGGTATSVVIGFLESPEYTSYNVSDEEFVATCYRVFCNRAATSAETASWVAQLEGGTSRDTVIRQFAQSPEWANICAYFKVNV